MTARQHKRRSDARWAFLIRLSRDPVAQRAYFNAHSLRAWFLKTRKMHKRWAAAPGGA